MAARPTWKGVLKISLVTIPIKVFPATESSDGLSFNQLHAECQTRIAQRKWCVACGREVLNTEIVKGFEFAKGQYVLLLEAELEAVQPPSTRVIDLVQFAPAAQLDPLLINRSYYLAPDGPAAAEAYAVTCAGMDGTVGIGKLAIYGREYLVAVRQHTYRRGALVLQTLHHAAEIRPIDAIEDLHTLPPRVKVEEVALARQVIAAFTRPLNQVAFKDDYRAELQRLIDAKIAGHEIVVPTVETPVVVSLRDALVQSLAATKTTKPAKVTLPAKRKRAS